MRRSLVGAAMTLAAVAGAWNLMSVPASGQAKATGAPPLVITAYGGETPKTRYVAPKTPWGGPDLEGVWSTDDTSGIPMARPAQYGDRLYLNDEEYGKRTQQIERAAAQGDQEAVGRSVSTRAAGAFKQTP